MLYAVAASAEIATYVKKHTQKLKDISADPKSAGELGGVLIKWVRNHFFCAARLFIIR
jgi:hypothetical protein